MSKKRPETGASEVTTVDLGRLRYGHDERAPAATSNPRKANRADGIDQLAASIHSVGIIQPLAVVDGGEGFFYVSEGNRRLAALERLRDAGKIAEDYAVKINVIPIEVAREAALAANIVRVPLHEADQYEAFKALENDGLSEEAIASRFAIDAKRVKRILALGNLSPIILRAWRDGQLGHQAAEAVKAFTLAPSLKDQERVFKKLYQADMLYPSYIREEFGAGRGDAGKYLTFIGREAYEAAGGKVVEDLFGDNHVISDPALAKQLADDELNAECARLMAEGWSWASPIGDLPSEARWNWRQLASSGAATPEEEQRLADLRDIADADDQDEDAVEYAEREIDALQARINARGYDDEAKAKSGCILSIGYNGQLEIKFGVVKPKESRSDVSKGPSKSASKEKAAPTISNALAHRLSVQLTKAAAEAMVKHPNHALEIAIAALLSNQRGSRSARLYHDGMGSLISGRLIEFHAAYYQIAAMSPVQRLNLLATLVGKSLDFQTQNAIALPLKDKNVSAICEVLGPELVDAARQVFDAEDYFGSISKPLILKAIEEALNADEARKVAGKAKSDLVKFAIANVVPTGWLPAELRTTHYDGPGSKATKTGKPKPAEKTKATAKKKSKPAGARRGKAVPEAEAA